MPQNYTRSALHLIGLTFLLVAQNLPAADREILFPVSAGTDVDKFDWVESIRERIPPLTQELSGRWPLMLWRTIPVAQISKEVAEMLLDRGLVPALPMDRSSIDAAKILQAIGAPVVLTAGSGAGTAWPYDLQPDKSKWAYEFQEPEPQQTEQPVPTLFSGWSIASSGITATLQSFRDADVTVDAAWLDYEGLPFQANYSNAINSINGPELLPARSLKNAWAFARYTRQLWISLMSTYVAAPIREIYPRVSVTNWLAVLSLPNNPVLSWYEYPLPMIGPTLFTATNPVAYGIDTAFNAGAMLNAMSTQRDVDRIYTQILLRQVSADSYARRKIAPELESIVWVARWVRDNPARLTPIMSRPAYREVLRHLWLRGVDAMEIFSPVREGFADLAIQEVEDAAMVFNEMLSYEKFLSSGTVLNHEYTINNQLPVLWSGLKAGNRAIVRAVSFSGKTETILVEPWPDAHTTIQATIDGAMYILNHIPGNKAIRTQKLY